MEKPNKQDYKPTEINCAEDIVAWEMAYNNKLRMYCEHLEDKLKNHSDLSNVRLSSKEETLSVLSNRAEHFKNIGNHTHSELECRNAIDIIEKLVPPSNFEDEV